MTRQPTAKTLCKAFSATDKRGTGAFEPVVLYTQFGKGRGFNLVLGHDAAAMRNAGWRTLMLRGTEWAATGKVTIPVPPDWPSSPGASAVSGIDPDAALKAIADYKFGQSRKGLATVERLSHYATTVPALRKDLAAKIAAMLGAQASPDCKKFLCRQLSLVGSEAEVPMLVKLLADKELSLAARSALERIPGKEVLATMRGELSKLTGPMLMGTLATLGERRDSQTVDAIREHLTSRDPGVAEAAIDALGKIGGAAALEALVAARPKLPKELRPVLADALLRCADGLLSAGSADEAAAIYRDLSAPSQPRHVRIAAFPGTVACQKEEAVELLLGALTGQDRALQMAAVRCVSTTGGQELTKALADRLPEFPPDVRVGIIAALGARGDRTALAAVMEAVDSDDANIRRAALTALGDLGDASTVSLLAKLAATSGPVEQRIARGGLVRLRGADVNAAMVKLLREGQGDMRRELIVALAGRGAREAVPALLEAGRDKKASVRKEAFKAVGLLGDAAACQSLIKLLDGDLSSGDRRAVENALVTLCRRAGFPEKGGEAVLAGASHGSVAQRCSLLRALGVLGGPEALAVVRAATKESGRQVCMAGLRALAEWPDGTPLDDLLAIARTAKETLPKALALRGFARLSGRTKKRSPQEMTKLFADALKLADRPDEKKALLGELGRVQCLAAMRLSLEYLKEPALADEAGLAIAQIAQPLWKAHETEVLAAIRKVMKASQASAVRQQAITTLLKFGKPRNLALGATATSPDGLDKDGASHGDQAAIDGNLNTYWDEANSKKLYVLKVTFKEPTEVSALSMVAWQHHSYAAKDFDIVCDEETVKTVQGAVYDNNELIVAFPATRCTSLELRITGYYPQSPAIRELGLYHVESAEDLGAGRPAVPAKPSYAWRQANEALALLNHGRVVWQFNYQKKEGKPYFHPVCLVDGTELTWLRPADHPWHRALWFSWKHINRLNYWEEDRRTRLSQGRTEVGEVRVHPGKDHTARIEMTLTYRPPGQAPVVGEKRLMTVSAPDEAGRYRIDWQSVFTAGEQDAILDRTAIPGQKGGAGHGGYAGLSARIAKSTSGWQVLNSEGLRDAKAHGQNARWLDFSGRIAFGEAAGIAMFDHPQNLRHPSPWYVTMNPRVPFGYFSPAVLFREPYTLAAGKSLTLRYRVLVHPGRADQKLLETEWKAFAEGKG